MVLWYKNSFLASLVSILGCICLMGGIMGAAEGEEGMAFLILVGIPLIVWGKIISNNKAFKKWWKQIEEKNLEPQLPQSVELCKIIYSKNPCKRTLKKLAQYNPTAVQVIEEEEAAKKAAKKATKK